MRTVEQVRFPSGSLSYSLSVLRLMSCPKPRCAAVKRRSLAAGTVGRRRDDVPLDKRALTTEKSEMSQPGSRTRAWNESRRSSSAAAACKANQTWIDPGSGNQSLAAIVYGSEPCLARLNVHLHLRSRLFQRYISPSPSLSLAVVHTIRFFVSIVFGIILARRSSETGFKINIERRKQAKEDGSGDRPEALA